jgi:uncharacterized protein
MAEDNLKEQYRGETNLGELLRSMKPRLNEGEFVFCNLQQDSKIDSEQIICIFQEQEGRSVILKKEQADILKLNYSSIFSWITLTIHSSLEAVGLTAAFSKALSDAGISCNVVAAFFHDHIFIAKTDAVKAMTILENLSNL